MEKLLNGGWDWKILLLAVLLLPASATADLYVSPSGSDGTSCTIGAPCRQINRANALATPGTTINVAPGSYAPATLTKSGTASARIRYLSTTKWGAKLSGNTTYIIRVTGPYVDVEGFDVTGGSSVWDGISLNGHHSRAIGNWVHDTQRTVCEGNGAIVIHSGSTDSEVLSNFITDIGVGAAGTCEQYHGIYTATFRTKIANNVITRVRGDGITSWHTTGSLTIVNNTVDKAGYHGIVISNDDNANPAGHRNSYIANNIVTNSWGYGIIGNQTEGGANTYANNNLFGNGNGNAIQPDSEDTVTGTTSTNPLFVNSAADNYQLTASSPAINSGTSTNAPATDFSGITRPQGAGVDRGAYEFAAVPPDPDPEPGDKFQVNDRVFVAFASANVRSGPGGTLLGTQPQNSQGTVIGGPTASPNGVIWYNINFDSGVDGWVGQDALETLEPCTNNSVEVTP